MECGRYAYFSVHLFWDAVFRCDFCSSLCFVYAPASLALHPEFLLFPLKQSRGKKNPSTCGCMWCVCACGKSSISAVAFLYLSGGDMFDCPRCIFFQMELFFFLTSVSCFFCLLILLSFVFLWTRFCFLSIGLFLGCGISCIGMDATCTFSSPVHLIVPSAFFFLLIQQPFSRLTALLPLRLEKNIRAFLLTSLACW